MDNLFDCILIIFYWKSFYFFRIKRHFSKLYSLCNITNMFWIKLFVIPIKQTLRHPKLTWIWIYLVVIPIKLRHTRLANIISFKKRLINLILWTHIRRLANKFYRRLNKRLRVKSNWALFFFAILLIGSVTPSQQHQH